MNNWRILEDIDKKEKIKNNSAVGFISLNRQRVKNEIFYRGYNGNYEPLESRNKKCIWVTSDRRNALKWGNEFDNVKVAKLRLVCEDKITSKFQDSRYDDYDAIELFELAVKKGFKGYWFDDNGAQGICADISCFEVVSENISEVVEEVDNKIDGKQVTEKDMIEQIKKLEKKLLNIYIDDDAIRQDSATIIITPNGTVIDTVNFDTHGEFLDYVYNEIVHPDELNDEDSEDYYGDGDGYSHAVEALNFMTLNTGDGFSEDRCKVVIWNKMSSMQTSLLNEWLERRVKEEKPIYVFVNGHQKTYEPEDYNYSSGGIVKSIQRSFLSGILESRINEEENNGVDINSITEKDVLNAVEKLSDKDDVSYNDFEAIENNYPVILLTPSGEILNVYDYDTHSQFMDAVFSFLNVKEFEADYEMAYDYVIEKLGFVTLNTGDGYSDDRCKIITYSRLTQKQVTLLREWIKRRIKEDKPIIVFVKNKQKTFYTNEYTYDVGSIIKSIQRSLSTGILENINFDYDGRGWITSTGEIISTNNAPHYEKEHKIKSSENYVKYNFGYERYIGLPENRLSSAQYEALTKLLDYFFINKSNVGIRSTDIEINYDMNDKGDFKWKLFSPKTHTTDDIIKLIKRYYTTGRLNESSNNKKRDEFDLIAEYEFREINKFLDRLGFEAEYVKDYEFENDSVGMFLNSIQDNASVFPIALNEKSIIANGDDLRMDIKSTIAHEIGHGIFQYLNDFFELDELDEEEVVEEFARDYCDNLLSYNELYYILTHQDDFNIVESKTDKKATHVRFINKNEYDTLQKIGKITPIDTAMRWSGKKAIFTFPLSEYSLEEYFDISHYLNDAFSTDYSYAVLLHINENIKPILAEYDVQEVEEILDKELQFDVTHDGSSYLVPEVRLTHYSKDNVVEIKTISEIVNAKQREVKESLNESWNDVYKIIKDEFGTTSTPPKGPAYILPTGEFLDVEKWWNSYFGKHNEDTDEYEYGDEERDTLYKGISPEEVSSKVKPGSFPVHSLVQYYINKKLGINDDSINTTYRLDDKDDTLVQNGCIKVNSGETLFDNLYVNLPNKRPTNQALESLDEYIFTQFYKNDKDVLKVYIEDNYWTATKYKRDDYADTKDIIKKITRYYTGAKLEESKQDVERFTKWAGKELADRYFKVRNRLQREYKDITWIMKNISTYALERDYIEPLEKTPTRNKIDNKGKEGAELVYENGDWKVYKINNYEASIKYGKGTKWCITGSNTWAGEDRCVGRDDFDKHTENNSLYFYLSKKDKRKYALEFNDVNDWALFNDEDYLEVGKGVTFKDALKYMGGDYWNPFDTTRYPTLPHVKGLPDIQKAYRDVIADIGENELDANDYISESLSNKEKEVIDTLDKYFGQKEPYVWSTYILPNGHFLNPENYKEDDAEWQNSLSYEHEDFYFVLDELGSVGDGVLEDYCIKVNVTFPYVAMPNNRATPEQFLALRKLIDRRGEFEYSFDEISDRVKNGSDVYDMTAPLIIILKNSEIAVDLDSTDVSSIVKMISRAYTTGTLLTESTLNEAKEDIDGIIVYRGEERSRINRFDNVDDEGNPVLYNDVGFSGLFFSADEYDVRAYGIPHIYKISNKAKIYEGYSSEEYCDDNNLRDVRDDVLYEISDGHTLKEIEDLFYEEKLDDMNSIFGARQYMARKHLEKHGYDGAHWEYEDDLTPEQYQIWNPFMITYIGPVDEFDEDEFDEDELDEDIDSTTYYRLELINPWNENMGGIFSSIWSVINHPDNDEYNANELEDIIDDLMNRHDVPSKWLGEDVKFAFKEKFIKDKINSELIKDLEFVLNNFGYKLLIDEIQVKDANIVWQDENQIAFVVK